MISLAKKIPLFISSVRCLRSSQAFYFARFRLLGQRRVHEYDVPADYAPPIRCRLLPLHASIISVTDHTICFLNHCEPLDVGSVNWRPQGVSRLWMYNLHYFDCLRQADVADDLKNSLLQSWIDQNPQMSRPAWEPYTTSLRCVNWVGFFVGKTVPSTWTSSLFLQARWLYANLERHILANHYFENIKSLLFCSFYFSALTGQAATEAARWKSFALAELESQLLEQFLPDGGHYERSPQYHLIMMQNCLEILSLLRMNQHGGLTICRILERVIQKGLALSASIARPDGRIPLFNDSAFDQTPDLPTLIQAAADLGIAILPPGKRWLVVAAEDFGLYGIRNADNWLMIDCGDIGPSYQPGHTHCDFLSYELMLERQMVVVDTGVFEYEPGLVRHLSRCTEAHNTVSVNGRQQSQVWGAFRVGRRAQKIAASIKRNNDTVNFLGSYTGFHSRHGLATHARSLDVSLAPDGSGINTIRISDTITIPGKRLVPSTGFVHLHPDISVRALGQYQYVLSRQGKEIAHFIVEDAAATSVEDTFYYPEFGVKQKSKKFVLSSHRNRITYRLQTT